MNDQSSIESSLEFMNERLHAVEVLNQGLQSQADYLREKLVATENNVANLYKEIRDLLLDRTEDFESELDHRGNLRNPHFADVRQLMSDLLANGRCRSLRDSYEKAVKIHLTDFWKDK